MISKIDIIQQVAEIIDNIQELRSVLVIIVFMLTMCWVGLGYLVIEKDKQMTNKRIKQRNEDIADEVIKKLNDNDIY